MFRLEWSKIDLVVCQRKFFMERLKVEPNPSESFRFDISKALIMPRRTYFYFRSILNQ